LSTLSLVWRLMGWPGDQTHKQLDSKLLSQLTPELTILFPMVPLIDMKNKCLDWWIQEDKNGDYPIVLALTGQKYVQEKSNMEHLKSLFDLRFCFAKGHSVSPEHQKQLKSFGFRECLRTRRIEKWIKKLVEIQHLTWSDHRWENYCNHGRINPSPPPSPETLSLPSPSPSLNDDTEQWFQQELRSRGLSQPKKLLPLQPETPSLPETILQPETPSLPSNQDADVEQELKNKKLKLKTSTQPETPSTPSQPETPPQPETETLDGHLLTDDCEDKNGYVYPMTRIMFRANIHENNLKLKHLMN